MLSLLKRINNFVEEKKRTHTKHKWHAVGHNHNSIPDDFYLYYILHDIGSTYNEFSKSIVLFEPSSMSILQFCMTISNAMCIHTQPIQSKLYLQRSYQNRAQTLRPKVIMINIKQ